EPLRDFWAVNGMAFCVAEKRRDLRTSAERRCSRPIAQPAVGSDRRKEPIAIRADVREDLDVTWLPEQVADAGEPVWRPRPPGRGTGGRAGGPAGRERATPARRRRWRRGCTPDGPVRRSRRDRRTVRRARQRREPGEPGSSSERPAPVAGRV